MQICPLFTTDHQWHVHTKDFDPRSRVFVQTVTLDLYFIFINSPLIIYWLSFPRDRRAVKENFHYFPPKFGFNCFSLFAKDTKWSSSCIFKTCARKTWRYFLCNREDLDSTLSVTFLLFILVVCGSVSAFVRVEMKFQSSQRSSCFWGWRRQLIWDPRLAKQRAWTCELGPSFDRGAVGWIGFRPPRRAPPWFSWSGQNY